MQVSKTVNFSELLAAKTHKARTSGAFIHIFNVLSGKLEYVLKKNPSGATKLVEKEIEGSLVLVEEDISLLPTVVRVSPEYSAVLLDLICEKVVEGMSLKKICEMPGMPSYATLMRWRRVLPEVEEQLQIAREDRGEYLRDLALEAVENTDEDSVGADSLKHKALVWAAGVDNSRYSPKAKVEATLAATTILVHTGISTDAPEPLLREARPTGENSAG